MAENLMIIVTGAPGTGKTTLSRKLADKFSLSVINKDDIKELIYDNMGIKDGEWALKLGITSYKLTYFCVEKLLKTGKPFIVEGNFDNKYADEFFLQLKSRINYRALQIFCHTEERVLYERYINRDASGERHPAHMLMTVGFEEYYKNMNNKTFKLDFAVNNCIDIDTTTFEDVNLMQVYEEVEKSLNSENKLENEND